MMIFPIIFKFFFFLMSLHYICNNNILGFKRLCCGPAPRLTRLILRLAALAHRVLVPVRAPDSVPVAPLPGQLSAVAREGSGGWPKCLGPAPHGRPGEAPGSWLRSSSDGAGGFFLLTWIEFCVPGPAPATAAVLKKDGHEVVLEKIEDWDVVELVVNGEVVFHCNIKDLEFGGDGKLDPLCEEARVAVLKAY
uniref:Uncharacterized protein n=1 Tax=Oryctolagus cuniculus TaxID=9986 RepID=A0A5F9C6Q5_RABIT